MGGTSLSSQAFSEGDGAGIRCRQLMHRVQGRGGPQGEEVIVDLHSIPDKHLVLFEKAGRGGDHQPPQIELVS